VKNYAAAAILLGLVVVVSGLTLDLKERRLVRVDKEARAGAGKVAGAIENKNDSVLAVFDNASLENFNSTETYYWSVNNGKVSVCFVPDSKAHRVGMAEQIVVLGNPEPEFVGAGECAKKDYTSLASSCVECIER